MGSGGLEFEVVIVFIGDDVPDVHAGNIGSGPVVWVVGGVFRRGGG